MSERDSQAWESQLRVVLGQAQTLMSSLALTPCGRQKGYIIAEDALERFESALKTAIQESIK